MTVNHDVAGSSPAWGATSFKSELYQGFGFFRFLSGEGCVWCGGHKIKTALKVNALGAVLLITILFHNGAKTFYRKNVVFYK